MTKGGMTSSPSSWIAARPTFAAPSRSNVVAYMREALERWLAYRDDVAEACGIVRGPNGPELARV